MIKIETFLQKKNFQDRNIAIAKIDGTVVAFLNATHYGSNEENVPVYEFISAFCKEEFRRRGIFSKLRKSIISEIQQRHSKFILTTNTNHPAVIRLCQDQSWDCLTLEECVDFKKKVIQGWNLALMKHYKDYMEKFGHKAFKLEIENSNSLTP